MREESEILWVKEMFLLGGVSLRRSDFDHSNFSKLETAFCEYWISIKIKISMTCLYKEYEIKTKMAQEQWLQLNMISFFLGYNMKIVIYDGGTEIYVLNASVLSSSFLESKLFTFRCPKCMPLLLNTFYLSLLNGIEGRLSSNKDDSVSPLLSIRKETWNCKFSHLLQSLHISLSKRTMLLNFLYTLRLPLDSLRFGTTKTSVV